MITAQIIADSINPAGDRITTGLWTYPRFIHSEIMTHRMLAKNSASSRAIPVEKMIAAVRENPAMFEQYGAANKGMAAQELMSKSEAADFQTAWKMMGRDAALWAEHHKSFTAKQIVNRILEPWMHMTIIITGTDWHNFFALRAHPAAQPEFQVLAYRWLDAYLKSEPVKCEWGQWHLPLVTNEEWVENQTYVLQQLSVARCARVSYTRHDAEDTPESCAKLHDRLLESGHMSPFEHQAQAVEPLARGYFTHEGGFTPVGSYFGCFKGWRPYRKMLPNENRTGTREDLEKILADKPGWITL